MSFWEKIQEDLKQNLQEGLEIFREGSSVFTEKIEEFTDEGKKKYQIFNLNMKVQEEFAKLGGLIYDLSAKKSKNPFTNMKVKSILAKINKMEDGIKKLDGVEDKKPAKKAAKKRTTKKKAATRKKAAVKKAPARANTKKKAAVKTKKS